MDPIRPLDETRFSLTPEGELWIHGSACTSCGVRSHPSRLFCPACSDKMVDDSTSVNEGTIETFTIVHQEIPERLIDSPYLLAEIEITTGLRLRCTSTSTKEVTIGSSVELTTQEFETVDGPRLGLIFSLKE